MITGLCCAVQSTRVCSSSHLSPFHDLHDEALDALISIALAGLCLHLAPRPGREIHVSRVSRVADCDRNARDSTAEIRTQDDQIGELQEIDDNLHTSAVSTLANAEIPK